MDLAIFLYMSSSFFLVISTGKFQAAATLVCWINLKLAAIDAQLNGLIIAVPEETKTSGHT